MFTKSEVALFMTSYFRILRIQDNCISVQSVNTGHCWIIYRGYNYAGITLMHKHHINDPYYHTHLKQVSIRKALKEIFSHDSYVLHRITNFN